MPADSVSDPAIWGDRQPDPPAGPSHEFCSAYFEQPMGYRTLRPEGAGNWLITFTLAGTGRFRQPGDVDVTVQIGDVVLVEPTAYSDYGTDDDLWCFHWCHFQPLAGWQDWLILDRVGQGLHRATISTVDVRARLDDSFQRLHSDLLAGGPYGMDLTLTALAEILLVANREQGQHHVLDTRISQALAAIHQAPAAPHSVASLARQSALSPSRFAHLFREETGEPVMHLVHHVRLHQACRLLATTDEPVAVIAQSVGYHSPHYFSRHFKEHHGMSPTAYREHQRRS